MQLPLLLLLCLFPLLVSRANADATRKDETVYSVLSATEASLTTFKHLVDQVPAVQAQLSNPKFRGALFVPHNKAFSLWLRSVAAGYDSGSRLSDPSIATLIVQYHTTTSIGPYFFPAEPLAEKRQSCWKFVNRKGAKLEACTDRSHQHMLQTRTNPPRTAKVLAAYNINSKAVVYVIDSVLLPASIATASPPQRPRKHGVGHFHLPEVKEWGEMVSKAAWAALQEVREGAGWLQNRVVTKRNLSTKRQLPRGCIHNSAVLASRRAAQDMVGSHPEERM